MIFCSRYGSSRNILSKIPSFKIIFSLNISGSLNIREEGRVELKNRNNNTDIFSLSVAWLAQRERDRIDISIEKKNFHEIFHEIGDGKRTVVTDRGRKKEEKREGRRGKNTTTPFIPPAKVSCLRNDSRYASRRTRQRFQLYPLRRLLAAFYFAARRSAVKLHRYNRVSRFEEKSVAGVGAVSVFPVCDRLLKTGVALSSTTARFPHRGNFSFYPIRNFRSIEFQVFFFFSYRRRLNVN